VTKLKVKATGRTDVGLKRDHNEDSLLISQELGLFAVADGMGGHAAGEVASKTATSMILDFVGRMSQDQVLTREQTAQEGLNAGEKILYLAIAEANRRLCDLSEENPAYFGMGTTIAAVYLAGELVHIGHVGDSRVYCYRDNGLDILTQDHSWVNEQLQKNVLSQEEARNHRWRNVITRALGNRADVEVDLKTIQVAEGDILLICSDGLTTMVPDSQIAKCIQAIGQDLDRIGDELIRMANEAGGHDNISLILIRVEPQAAGEDDAVTKPPPLPESAPEADPT